jgi:hypothetical protein
MQTMNDIDTIGPQGTELCRYRISTGERVLMAWRRSGGVEVTDRPTEVRARGYVVDRGMQSLEQLRAFVGDYVGQAERFDACPMSPESLGLVIENSENEAVNALVEAA